MKHIFTFLIVIALCLASFTLKGQACGEPGTVLSMIEAQDTLLILKADEIREQIQQQDKAWRFSDVKLIHGEHSKKQKELYTHPFMDSAYLSRVPIPTEAEYLAVFIRLGKGDEKSPVFIYGRYSAPQIWIASKEEADSLIHKIKLAYIQREQGASCEAKINWLTDNLAHYPALKSDAAVEIANLWLSPERKCFAEIKTRQHELETIIKAHRRPDRSILFLVMDIFKPSEIGKYIGDCMYWAILNNDQETLENILFCIPAYGVSSFKEKKVKEFISKLHLYLIATNDVRDEGFKYLLYPIALMTDSQTLTEIKDDFSSEKNLSKKRSLIKSFIEEAEKHLDMCSDPRINRLTGNKMLWNCSGDSPFAPVEHFSNGFDVLTFPNPSPDGKFAMRCIFEDTGRLNLSISDSKGTEYYNYKEEKVSGTFQHEFVLYGLPPGMYTLRLRHRNRVMAKKIVIE